MSVNRKEIKAAAKQQINGYVGTFFGLTIIIGLIISAASATAIGPILLGGAFELGVALYFLGLARKGTAEFETGFHGFKRFGDSFVLYLLRTIFVSLWTLLLFIPGIVASLSYSMAFYILADKPEISGYEAIKQSKEMMKGHKWELFVLYLSFFGWFLLSLITCGLALIYVNPYMEATLVNFYEKIKDEIPVVEDDSSDDSVYAKDPFEK